MHPSPLTFDAPPYRLSGVVVGALLNHRAVLAALGDAASRPPYKAPPRAPVLYFKPRNTLATAGAAVPVPADVPEFEVGATLGIVIGRTACHVHVDDAFDHIAGYTVVNDVSVPHASFYRPSLRFKARDGSCPIGPRVVVRHRVADPDHLAIEVRVDGELKQRSSTADMVRPVAQLIADITEFMTLGAGDLLLLGVAAGAPRVRAGQHVAIEVEGVGTLTNPFVAQPAPAEAAP